MGNIDTVFLIFIVIMAIGLLIALTLYPLWIVLHQILPKRLDAILFKEPYFQKSELVNYQCWPLSYLKSMNYIYLIAAPSLAKKKRFKGFNEPLPIGPGLRVACKLNFSLLMAGMLMFFVFFGYMGVALLIFT